MPNAVNMQVSGSTLYVSGTLSAGANMRIEVPLTVSSLSVSGSIVGDLYVSGTLTALELKTTVISSSIIYRSGSTKSGDSLDDVHEVTGSLIVVGNILGALTGTMTGSLTGSVLAVNGISGSLQRLTTGETYLAAGTNVSIITQSNGQVQVSAVGLADVSASYVTIGNTGSLPNERQLSASFGLILQDNGANSTVNFRVNDNEIATLSGSRFTGPVSASAGLSGSLQQVAEGLSYLVAGQFISITTQSNGQVVIGNTYVVTGAADASASYVTIGNTGSLPNERALSASFGLLLQDNGAGSTVSLRVNDSDVATLSGSTFRGSVYASGGLTGSLQLVSSGVSYLVGGFDTQVTSQSNGQVEIAHQVSLATVTSDVTASRGLTLADATAGAFNVIFPNALQNQGKHMHVKKIDVSANAVNVKTVDAGSQLIDGLDTQSLTAQWTTLSAIASGSNWYIV